ncbi:hypothetical protein GCM10009114_22290 [Aliiglaciecola litoralis]|uniref:Uncharacterized protein n=2 Tax=Aliiglaciecola litoralis TaxID=582857 RepID=A0ABN1LKI8_9ALTE
MTDNSKKYYAAPNRKLWVYGILLLLILAGLTYYGLMNRKDRSTNHDYYRVLYEASNTFNENLQKLQSMHKFKESVSSIRSLLPSYSIEPIAERKRLEAKTFNYLIVGQKLHISSPESPDFKAELDLEDILPQPKKGFSQYLFANEQSEVLSRVGNEKTISIVDLSSINQQIQRKNKQFQLNFSEAKAPSNKDGPSPLPSYSNHVDMKISYGEFRVYVFPFALSTPLDQIKKVENKTAGVPDVKQTLDRIFLVGLLPQHKLESRDNGHWNVSLLAVTLVSLVFMWCMLRLFLLPKNQSITRSFRVFTTAASYLFYIVIIALTLAYFQKSLLQIDKDKTALRYANYLNQSLAADIEDVFTQLSQYRDFYSLILEALTSMPEKVPYSGYSQEDVRNFNDAMRRALLTQNAKQDPKGQLNETALGTAITQNSEFPLSLNYPLAPDDPEFINFELNDYAIGVMLHSYRSNQSEADTLDFHGLLQKVSLTKGESLATSLPAGFVQQPKNKILSVFALNLDGNSVLPSVNFQESNSLPETFNLSHRNYYKMVRDQKGWDLTLGTNTNQQKTFHNVYIQRLLNVNNGTRGTTISMPITAPSNLFTQDKNELAKPSKDYIIGADVLLPSMTLGQSPPYDFVYMVVDRSSGKVLFHNDSERSLVENLYYSGDIHSPLSKWLKAGLDHYTELGSGSIDGTYHGQEGKFAVSNSVVDSWAIVVFYPNDSLQTFMTNQFLYITTTFCLIMLIMIIGIYAARHFVWTSALKKKLNIPAKLNVRLVMLVSSVLFSASYSLYIFGFNIEGLIVQKAWFDWSLWLPFAGLLIATVVVYRGCYRYFCYPLAEVNAQTHNVAKRGSKRLILVVLIAVAMHFIYLQRTADAPQKSLDFHYQQLACNWLNYERKELNTIGLSRYPNSITSQRISAFNLLPLNEKWRSRLTQGTKKCAAHSSQVNPDDYPKLSSVFGATYLWQWINIYLLDEELTASYQPSDEFANFEGPDISVSGKFVGVTFLFALLLSAAIWGWFRFNARVLWNRLYCPERFLQHIERITGSVHTLHFEERNTNLIIECDTIKLNGIGLALLLRTMSYQQNEPATSLLAGFDKLFKMSPCLQKFSQENYFLPNLKINLSVDDANKNLNLELWDIETCLEKSEYRQLLLDLIMEFKSLTLSKQLNSFTLFTGFHSLQRVKMKDPLALDQSKILDNSEYLSWAECLMDFVVNVPENFKQGIDWQLLHDEVSAFPELNYLNQQFEPVTEEDSWSQIWKRDEELHIESRWTTINYILLNAEALYRFKWESCSSAEKLALLNLAKKQKLNPANTQMIEHLALNGLITVRNGSLDIVNLSFAHFVLHAETAATLNALVVNGEAGIWKNYKLPLGIMILLIIGGIALTSGESIYIIAASMAGVLGTIASVTNSANLLRGQMKE